jgi:hypothetical protein
VATVTANHLYLSHVLKAVSGPWSGETSGWGWRFSVNGGGGGEGSSRPSLDEGQFLLNTFDVHTKIETRAVSLSSVAGSLLQSWVGDDIPPEEEITDQDIDFFLTKAWDFWASVKAYVPSPWQLQHIKLYAVKQDGKSPLGPNTWTPGATQAGAGSSYYSPEVAACLSHYTAHRHKSGRGRLYLGPLSLTAGANDGTLSPTFMAALRDAGKAVQDSVRTRGTPSNSCTYVGIVWQRSPGTHGSVINAVRVGDEADHQERRTKSRPETYLTANVV